ncbi:hypothetical protein NDA01_30390 [Trichocoleus desertorum AS-A10]|uniref:LamG-like jellyroll fold domain-containing protein n=1 Tax=Trichocoleus desertorum TaxID=1481672 RepID=UPI003298685F
MLLSLKNNNCKHVNTVTHEGKVVVVATDADGTIYYTVKQDGFEDSYLNQLPNQRTGWEDWKQLELPNESAEDQSVVAKEAAELTYKDASQNTVYLLRSLYTTQYLSAVAPVQLVSGLGHLYVFRQSKSNTLLVDRFVLDGLTNQLTRKLEVRFKRSKQKHKPSSNQRRGSDGNLASIDSLDFSDINGNLFYEPTTELCLINNLASGCFSVVLLPTSEQDKHRWYFFAYNSATQKVELTTLRASEEGLFEVKDYTILDPEPRSIPGIIKRTLNLGNLAVAKGLTATRYNVQRERQTDDGMQLLRESVRVMLAIGTSTGNVAAISFAVAADGTLSQIKDIPDSTKIRRNTPRQVLLPLNTLDEIKAIGQSNLPPQGMITGFTRGENDRVILTSEQAAKLDEAEITQVKITGGRDCNCLHSSVRVIDRNTFEITSNNAIGGSWEVIPEEETGLTYNGIVTSYEIIEAGKLKVTALNHGLDNGDAVQIVNTKDYNGTYTVTKIDGETFSLDGTKWQPGTAINARLRTEKRRGITFDKTDTGIEAANFLLNDLSAFAIEGWVKVFSLPETTVSLFGQTDVIQLDIVNRKLRVWTSRGGEVLADYDYPLNDWHHIAVVGNGTSLTLYLDGQHIKTGGSTIQTSAIGNGSSSPLRATYGASTQRFKIGPGVWSASRPTSLNIHISDVRIWNTARTVDEINNNKYLQLTGREVGLLSYWRLDAIFESENERKVINFAVDGHDGVVRGGAYVSAATLQRNLPGTSTAAIKYENEELVAVAERATYTEEFEFKTSNNVTRDNVSGNGDKIFTFAYKGKKNRNSQDWITITPSLTTIELIEATNWYKASSTFTVPDGVSMVRSFGISDIKGIWTTLEIRKHRIQLVSNSITEQTYLEDIVLETLADNQLQLQESLKQLENKESQEVLLIKTRKKLIADIASLSLTGTSKQQAVLAKAAAINSQKTTITGFETQLTQLQSSYQTEQNNPLNYWCKLICQVNEAWICRINTKDKSLLYADVGADGNPYFSNNHFKFVPTTDGYYLIVSKYEDRALCASPQAQVYAGNSSSSGYGGREYEWKPEKYSEDYYLIRHRPTGDVLDRGGGDFGVLPWPQHGKSNQQWKIVIIGEQTNSNIANALSAVNAKQIELNNARRQLTQLEDEQTTLTLEGTNQSATKRALEQQLEQVNTQLPQLQTELNAINNQLIASVRNSQQTPQRNSQQTPQSNCILQTDGRSLVTQGALLGFVRPASRLSAIETCEGNVQLSYFDDQGRMRQTNFDATYDNMNAAGEQWIPDSLRTCLNFNSSSSVVTLDIPVPLGEEWTIEAWFAYPLPENLPPATEGWNTLIKGTTDIPVLVQKGANSDLLGIYLSGSFISSGYDLTSLSTGWYHLTAVAKGNGAEAKTTFYINGRKVGETRAKTTGNIVAIGNNTSGQPFGKVAEVRIWEIALSAEEIAVNSKTLLTGNEPGLRAYYPFNEATGTTVRDTTSRDRDNKSRGNIDGTVVGASWWGCAAPIGFLHQISEQPAIVMQFDGANDCIDLGERIRVNSSFTQEVWIYSTITDNAYHGVLGNQPAEGANKRAPSIWVYQQNKICMSFGNETQVYTLQTDAAVLAPNQWNHVAVTFDGNECRIYVNGQLRKRGTSSFAQLANTPIKYIGKVDNYFQGKLFEVRIWNKCRTKAEIGGSMNNRLTGNEAGLVGYWQLNHIQSEGPTRKVANLVDNMPSVVQGAILVSDQNLPPIFPDGALVSSEYSTVSQDRSVMMRRFFAASTSQGVQLLPDKRVEELELQWIGNGQFAPALLGYIEGPPPIPSENLTLEENYNGATSVELALSEDVEFKWTRSQDVGVGAKAEVFLGIDEEGHIGVGYTRKISIKKGYKGELEINAQKKRETSITSSSSSQMTDTLKLCGTQEQTANFSHLGKRFIPKNIGYALVVSALADVFVTRLERTKKMIGYQVLPVENIPPDVNTITFLINPAYTMSGSLDGLTGSSATSQRFFKHVPEMRSQFGSLYPASYYRLQEAYDLKQKIEQQDKDRESYFAQFNTRLVDEASLDRETYRGSAPGDASVSRLESQPAGDHTPEQTRAQEKEQQTKEAQTQQSSAVAEKQAEIDKLIEDQNMRANATASFAGWQKKMESIQIRSGKRNIVNTYVWDADGGLRTESQSFAKTAEHTIGSSMEMNFGSGYEGDVSILGFGGSLTALATVSLTQTMTKTETRSKGIQLNVDLSGVESRGITDYSDYPIQPGEKVGRYRFMSFYLEGSTNNFNDFFSYVVDPEWLAGNSEEARALRQARGKANKTWRVLHRVTYVERPALMGFGRDMRQLPPANSINDLGQLQTKVDKLEQQNAEMQRKLDAILKKLDSNS